MVAASADPACGDLHAALERLVTGTSTDIVQGVVQAQTLAQQSLWFLSSHWYVNGFQGAPNPVADWRPNMIPDTLDNLMDFATDTISAPSAALCDTTGV